MNLKEKKQGLVDLSFINNEVELIQQKVQILEQIKDILGERYSEILPYGVFLSNQKSED